jgi:anti-anti-sigma factor
LKCNKFYEHSFAGGFSMQNRSMNAALNAALEGKKDFDGSILALSNQSTVPPGRIGPYTLVTCRHAEIVRGVEHGLVEEITAHFVAGNILLDLASVKRVDAAGISALLGLYQSAHNAGRRFALSSPSRHVKEVLEIFGLERLLVSRMVIDASHSGPICGISAA